MHAETADKKDVIVGIFRHHGVLRLEVFGSVARGTDFDPTTRDIDFLVEFEPETARGA